MNKYLIFTSIGFELVGIMVASIYLGQLIDDHYKTRGVALIVLMFTGLASWFIHLIFLIRRIQKSEPDEPSE
ncbi:MAG: AtpZ/AtpI family protein [Bdellovibrionaceae bacterium]|nr:AtpZ/AtpI family protein [Pseudobdellovibrionaceae bacterium]